MKFACLSPAGFLQQTKDTQIRLTGKLKLPLAAIVNVSMNGCLYLCHHCDELEACPRFSPSCDRPGPRMTLKEEAVQLMNGWMREEKGRDVDYNNDGW